jgi:hypothetical protein
MWRLENNLKKIMLSRGNEKSDRLKTGTRLRLKAEALFRDRLSDSCYLTG